IRVSIDANKLSELQYVCKTLPDVQELVILDDRDAKLHLHHLQNQKQFTKLCIHDLAYDCLSTVLSLKQPRLSQICTSSMDENEFGDIQHIVNCKCYDR